MSDSTETHSKREGGCLCGAVKFVASEASNHVGACHCGSCRKWGGGPFVEIECGAAVEFTGDDNISLYNSSDWAERGFCKQCGTHLFYRLKDNQAHHMPVGLFDNDSDLVFKGQVFIDEKPHYYNFSEQTENLTGAELFAKFAPPAD